MSRKNAKFQWFIVKFCCRPPREVVSWKNILWSKLPNLVVDLHERSWVEKFFLCHAAKFVRSTSTRGRELKSSKSRFWCVVYCCRPPREVVSWKNSTFTPSLRCVVDLHERSWVEKSYEGTHRAGFDCRPPREVVSWKWQEIQVYTAWRSTSTRGRELKNLLPAALNSSQSSTSTRGRELKNFFGIYIF